MYIDSKVNDAMKHVRENKVIVLLVFVFSLFFLCPVFADEVRSQKDQKCDCGFFDDCLKDPSCEWSDGSNALMKAVTQLDLKRIEYCLQRGWSVNHKSKSGHTALLDAAWTAWADGRCEPAVKIAKALIKNGAKGNAADENGWTAFHVLSQHNCIAMAELFFENGGSINGGSINVVDKYGVTPLMLAIVNGKTELAKMFIENGALVETKNICGMSAIMFACSSHDYEVSKMLLEKGANPHEVHLHHYMLSSLYPYGRCESYPPRYQSCEDMKDLLNKYKFKMKTTERLRGQIPEEELAWFVERNLNIGPVLKDEFKIKIDQGYIPWSTNEGSLFKHVGIKFNNGSIFSYSDDSGVLESRELGEKDPSQHYVKRRHGMYEIGYNAELMDEAIIITRERWDRTKQSWDEDYYDVKTHNCQHYIDEVIETYLGLGGVVYRKFVPVLRMED